MLKLYPAFRHFWQFDRIPMIVFLQKHFQINGRVNGNINRSLMAAALRPHLLGLTAPYGAHALLTGLLHTSLLYWLVSELCYSHTERSTEPKHPRPFGPPHLVTPAPNIKDLQLPWKLPLTFLCTLSSVTSIKDKTLLPLSMHLKMDKSLLSPT